MRRPASARFSALALALAAALTGKTAACAGKRGDFLQTDAVGVNLFTRDLTARTTRTVVDSTNLAEYVGLHYYAVDRVRFGMSVQLVERVAPEPPSAAARIQRVALLPTIGANFYDPFFAAVVFVVAPRSDGEPRLTLGVNALAGLAVPISKRASVSVAFEVPYTYYHHQTVGLIGVAGVGFRL